MKNENVNLFIEIDPEKKVVYISDYTQNKNGGGLAKKYKNKKDITRIFSNYLFDYINLYSSKKRDWKKYE